MILYWSNMVPHTIGMHSKPDRHIFLFNSYCKLSFKSSVRKTRVLWWIANAEAWKGNSWPKKIWVKNMNRITLSTYTTVKIQFIEFILLVQTDVFLSLFTETCQSAFAECSVWWSRESPIWQMLSTGLPLGAVGCKNWPLVPSAWSWRLPSTSSISNVYPLLEHSIPDEGSSGCRNSVLVSMFKDHLISFH